MIEQRRASVMITDAVFSACGPTRPRVANLLGDFGMSARLSKHEVAALREVIDGADVWGYGIAKHLRAIEKKRPELVSIVKAKARPAGHLRQPYFGAIATPEGRKFIESRAP